jgi:hypothetical protein
MGHELRHARQNLSARLFRRAKTYVCSWNILVPLDSISSDFESLHTTCRLLVDQSAPRTSPEQFSVLRLFQEQICSRSSLRSPKAIQGHSAIRAQFRSIHLRDFADVWHVFRVELNDPSFHWSNVRTGQWYRFRLKKFLTESCLAV